MNIGDFSLRMGAETVCETAIGFLMDAGINSLVTGAVAGVVGATAVTSLPAVVAIGVATIGVKMAGDAAVKSITKDKDATMVECASDFLLDSIEGGAKAVGGLANKFGTEIGLAV